MAQSRVRATLNMLPVHEPENEPETFAEHDLYFLGSRLLSEHYELTPKGITARAALHGTCCIGCLAGPDAPHAVACSEVRS